MIAMRDISAVARSEKESAARVEVGRKLENHAAHAFHRRMLIGPSSNTSSFFDPLSQQGAEIALQGLLLDAEHEMTVARLEVEPKRNAGRQDPEHEPRATSPLKFPPE